MTICDAQMTAKWNIIIHGRPWHVHRRDSLNICIASGKAFACDWFRMELLVQPMIYSVFHHIRIASLTPQGCCRCWIYVDVIDLQLAWIHIPTSLYNDSMWLQKPSCHCECNTFSSLVRQGGYNWNRVPRTFMNSLAAFSFVLLVNALSIPTILHHDTYGWDGKKKKHNWAETRDQRYIYIYIYV